MTGTDEQIFNDAVELIQETRVRAKLDDRPFVLGLLVESEEGRLATTLRNRKDEFHSMGATAIEWRDDALRGRATIGSEELYVSVQRADTVAAQRQ
ncbi:hypothetical protein ACFYO7_28035 [Nocardia salmonicida]|uniref:hypothetical protein n=1 Tax=Nocardia salmonicida TaxID=53431 RepID=UPI00367DECF0